MFNKKKCKNCIYSTYFNSRLGCGYFIHGPEKRTCLHFEGDKLVDRRGDDPKNCKLYVARSKRYKKDKVNISLPRKG